MRVQSSRILIIATKGKCPRIEKKYLEKGLSPKFICKQFGGGHNFTCPNFMGLTREGVIKCCATSKHPKNP